MATREAYPRSPPFSASPDLAASTDDHRLAQSPRSPSNVSRHLATRLDLNFFREWISECYADRGRPSGSVELGIKHQPRLQGAVYNPLIKCPATRGKMAYESEM